MLEPLEVRRAPVRACPEHEAAAREEFQDVVAGLEDLALKGLAATHDVAHALVRFARNPHDHELAGAVEPGEIRRIALVVLALHAGPFGNQRRGDHLAGVAPLGQRAVQHIPGAARLITRAELAIARDAVEPLLQFGEIVREPLEAGRALRAGWQDRNRDRLLVHIHAEVDAWASGRRQRCQNW
jgi:hypothetical protein